MNDSKKYTPVESVLDIYDDSRSWYYLPTFNGYEISNDGYVRSMKHFFKYPFGILIKPIKEKSRIGKEITDPLYELSDYHNIRHRIRLSQLFEIAMKNQYTIAGYPCKTYVTNPYSRNNPFFSYTKIKMPKKDEFINYKKFTIIQDPKDHPMTDMTMPFTFNGKKIEVPIYSLNPKNDTFYGRTEVRVLPTLEPVNLYDFI